PGTRTGDSADDLIRFLDTAHSTLRPAGECSAMTKRPHFRLMLPLAAVGVMFLSACGGSSGGGAAQVASIATAGSSGAAPTKLSSGDTEKELNDYTECLRKQGVDVPDITVDA